MIRVTVEILPARSEILNVGTFDGNFDCYTIKHEELDGRFGRFFFEGWNAATVVPHRYVDGITMLLADALQRCLRLRSIG